MDINIILFSGVMLSIEMLADLLSGSAARALYLQRLEPVSDRRFNSTSYGADPVIRPQTAAQEPRQWTRNSSRTA
jgi:hypothetical protein